MTKTGPELMKELMETLVVLEKSLLEVRASILELLKTAQKPSSSIELKDDDLVYFLGVTDGYVSQINHLSLTAWRDQLLGIMKDAQRYRLMRDQLGTMLPEAEDDAG
jgi:hypothetical protein